MITIHDGFAAAIRANIGRLREGERLLRTGQGEAGVHLMRTSSRRLRSTVQYLGRHLPRERRRGLQRGLRGLMSALAPARDLDVLLLAVDRTPGVSAEDASRLRGAIGRRREKACSRMERHLGGAAYSALLADLEAACALAGPPAVGLAIAAPSQVLRAVERALGAAPERWEASDEASLHEARKAVKRLRYALEAFQPGLGRPLDRAMERCREVQETFGVVQDAAMFSARLRALRSFAAGQVLAHAQARAEEARARLPRLWERALGERMLGRLASHLARRAARRPDPPPPVAVSLVQPLPAQAAS